MNNIYILIFALFFCSCVDSNKNNTRYTAAQLDSLHLESTRILNIDNASITHIDLNPFLKKKHFDMNALIEDLKLIFLETTDDSLLDGIYNVLVTDSAIFVHDSFKGGGIVIFTSDGKFVKRISNGQGPGELIRLYCIAFDSKNKELIAFQHSMLLFFSQKGEYLRSQRLPFGFYNFCVTNSGYIFKTLGHQANEHLDMFDNNTVYVTDKEFKLKYAALTTDDYGNVLGGYNYLYPIGDTVMITQRYCDTIYQFIDNTQNVKAKYVIDYHKKRLPNKYLYPSSYYEFEQVTQENDYYFFIGEYIETKNNQAFFLQNEQIGKTVIYRDKSSGNLIGGTNAEFNIKETPPIGFPKAVYNDYYIEYFLPPDSASKSIMRNSSMISEEDQIKLQNTKDDDNQILVFYKLKHF
jgi:hypothetical protein